MLDIKALRADPEAIAALLKKKGFDLDVATFSSLEEFKLKQKRCSSLVTPYQKKSAQR